MKISTNSRNYSGIQPINRAEGMTVSTNSRNYSGIQPSYIHGTNDVNLRIVEIIVAYSLHTFKTRSIQSTNSRNYSGIQPNRLQRYRIIFLLPNFYEIISKNSFTLPHIRGFRKCLHFNAFVKVPPMQTLRSVSEIHYVYITMNGIPIFLNALL